MPNTFVIKQDTIALSGTASVGIDLESYPIAGLFMPTLDSTSGKLQVSSGDTNWYDVEDFAGNPICFWSTPLTRARYIGSTDLAEVIGAKKARILLNSGNAEGKQNTGARVILWVLKDISTS